MSNNCLFILTCGRKQYIQDTILSWETNLQNFDGRKIIFDDSGDIEYRQWLRETYGDRYDIIVFSDDNLGLEPMMRNILHFFSTSSYEDIFMLEEDWVLNESLDFKELQNILNTEKSIQVRVTVEPWYPKQIKFGGVIGAYKEDGTYVEKETYVVFRNNTKDFFWSNNPSIFKADVFRQGVDYTQEYYFGAYQKPNYDNFAYYPKYPIVRHIGLDSAVGYATID